MLSAISPGNQANPISWENPAGKGATTAPTFARVCAHLAMCGFHKCDILHLNSGARSNELGRYIRHQISSVFEGRIRFRPHGPGHYIRHLRRPVPVLIPDLRAALTARLCTLHLPGRSVPAIADRRFRLHTRKARLGDPWSRKISVLLPWTHWRCASSSSSSGERVLTAQISARAADAVSGLLSYVQFFILLGPSRHAPKCVALERASPASFRRVEPRPF